MSDWWGSINSANPVLTDGWWCGALPAPGAIVTFNYNQFCLSFPELSYLPQAQTQQYFNLATYFCRNDGGRGGIPNAALQATALNFATAHIIALFAVDANGNPPSGLVGRVEHATEGSVNVSASWGNTVSDQEAWWIQTRYGAAFWNCTRAMRVFHYMRGFPRVMDPWRWRI
jgi:Protein of unknown function (DUF4054)